jgi:hypothetical protein
MSSAIFCPVERPWIGIACVDVGGDSGLQRLGGVVGPAPNLRSVRIRIELGDDERAEVDPPLNSPLRNVSPRLESKLRRQRRR